MTISLTTVENTVKSGAWSVLNMSPISKGQARSDIQRILRTRPGLMALIHSLLTYPVKRMRRRSRNAAYKEIIRVAEYLLANGAYLQKFVFRNTVAAGQIAAGATGKGGETSSLYLGFRRGERAELRLHTDAEILTYLKQLIANEIPPMVPKDVMKRLTYLKDMATNTPCVIRAIISIHEGDRSRALQLVLQLMVRLYENRESNLMDELTIALVFVPMLLGTSESEKLKTNMTAYMKVIHAWGRIIKCIPRGRAKHK